MSTTAAQTADPPKPPAHYAERADAGDVTWLEDAIEDYLGLTVTAPQRDICRAVAEYNKVLVVTANSLGKSYILAAITIVWLLVRYPAVSFATSGTERKMKRTYCKPVENLHGNARVPLPGEYKSRPERIEIDGEPEHFFEAASPKDAGELEGVHGAYTLAIIEEADKDAVDEDVIDAMRSLASDEKDRLIAIANPPEDETNSVYPYMDDHPQWEVLNFSTFDAHNVQVDLGNIDGPKIDGIAGISKLEEDWVEYNGIAWPGIKTAQHWSDPDHPDFRTDLSKRWYRRRAGIMPPSGASENRPINLKTVNAAYDPDATPGPRRGTGIDVARSGDRTVMIDERDGVLTVEYSEPGTDHTVQFKEIWRKLDSGRLGPISIDAVGEGSGKADDTAARYPDVDRFKAGENAAQADEYKDRWTEGLCELGNWLEAGGKIRDTRLREELQIAARTITLSERYYANRDDQVFVADPKERIKERLGRSPDHLDAAIQAVIASKELFPEDDGAGGTGTW